VPQELTYLTALFPVPAFKVQYRPWSALLSLLGVTRADVCQAVLLSVPASIKSILALLGISVRSFGVHLATSAG